MRCNDFFVEEDEIQWSLHDRGDSVRIRGEITLTFYHILQLNIKSEKIERIKQI